MAAYEDVWRKIVSDEGGKEGLLRIEDECTRIKQNSPECGYQPRQKYW